MTFRTMLASFTLLPLAALAASPRGLTISNGWFAMAPHTQVIGFFSVRNAGAQPLLVTGWQSPGCHAMHLEEASGAGPGDVNSGLTIPGKSRMAFVRGSYHLSCDGPNPTLRAGTRVPVTFSFRDGGTLTTSFDVRDVSAHQPGQPQAPASDAGGG